jgi:hypothetical protein
MSPERNTPQKETITANSENFWDLLEQHANLFEKKIFHTLIQARNSTFIQISREKGISHNASLWCLSHLDNFFKNPNPEAIFNLSKKDIITPHNNTPETIIKIMRLAADISEIVIKANQTLQSTPLYQETRQQLTNYLSDQSLASVLSFPPQTPPTEQVTEDTEPGQLLSLTQAKIDQATAQRDTNTLNHEHNHLAPDFMK